MHLIGILVLCVLWAEPAHAEPISLTVATVLGVSAFWGAVITYTAAFVLSLAVSFVASALLRPPKTGQSAGYSSGGSAQQTANLITVREPVAVKNIVYGQRRVAGKIVFAHVTDENRFLHMIIVFAGHEIDSFHTIYLNDRPVSLDGNEMVNSGEFTGLVRLKRHTGSPAQGADGTLINETRGLWETSDRLRGCAYIYARFEFEPSFSNPTYGGKVYQGGVPNLTCEIRGKQVYDPRTTTTYWTANSALCLADYLADPVFGIGIGYADIDETALIAAANACDESVIYDVGTGATEPRYETDGELLSSAEPAENIGYLLGAMHGRLHYGGDKWRILAGVYIAPTVALSDDDLRSGPTISTIASRRDLFNSVKGTFVDRQQNYIRADFQPISSPSYVSADGEEIWKDIDLPMTVKPVRARRIAKIEMQRSRQQITAVMPCKLTAWKAQAGDTITWTSTRYGWSSKAFEVRKAVLAIADDGTLGVDLHLAETASAVYDWTSSGLDWLDPAPDTNFPSAGTVKPPSNLRVTESLYTARDGGGVKARVTLAWDASPDYWVDHYEGFYRAVGATEWKPLGRTDGLELEWPDAVPGQYDFALRAVNHRRIASTSLVVRRQVAGLSAAPSPPKNFSVVSFGNVGGFASWDPPGDLDVAQGGYMVIRHSPLTSGATWADGISIGQRLYPAAATTAALPLKSGTYMAKFQDSTGQFSDVVSFVQRQDGALEFSALTGGTLDEAAGDFAGTKVNCYLNEDGALAIVGNDEFDDVGDVDALVNWDFAGGVVTDAPMVLGFRRATILGNPNTGGVLGDPAIPSVLGRAGSPSRTVLGDPASGIVLGRPRLPSAYYDWSTPIDLGSVKHCRLTVTCTAVAVDVFDDIDSRSGDVDSWASWDGEIVGDQADAWTVVQATDDDPASPSAVWTDWQRVDAAEFHRRGFRLRTYLNSKDAAVNIELSALSAAVEGVV